MTQPRDPRILLFASVAVPTLAGLVAGLAPGLRDAALSSPVGTAMLLAACGGLPMGLLFLGFRDLWLDSVSMKRLGYACFMLACAAAAFFAGGALFFLGWAPVLLFFAWTGFAVVSWPVYSRLHGLTRSLPAFLCAGVSAGLLCGLSYGLVGYADACRSRARECRGYAAQEEERLRRDILRDPWLDRGLNTCEDPLYRLCLSGRRRSPTLFDPF